MFKQLLAVAALSFAGQAIAGPVYNFTDNNAVSGGATGDILESLSATWDAGEEVFSWNTTFTNSDVKSFWLVVNDKENPKQVDTNELVIMYGDLATETLYTYVYNGANNANSYNTPGIHLQTDALSVAGNSISFTIDATDINDALVPQGSSPDAADYRGLVVGPDSIGIWFHFATASVLDAVDGQILNYRPTTQGWYDRANLSLTKVPEPGSIALMGLGLLGLGAARKRRSAEQK